MTSREQWKISYRRLRVVRREQRKANWDTMMFGTGVVVVPSNGSDPYHVPLEEVQFTKTER